MAVQRVRRVIRKIDPWTVLKVSLVFNAMMALVVVLGTVIFWAIFVNAGIPERINDLALRIGLTEGINLDGQVYFRVVVLLSVIGTIMMTGFFTLGAVIYNLISDLVGGIEIVVLEETIDGSGPRPRATLPVGREEAKPKRATLPAVESVAPPREDEDEEREPATARYPQTG